MIIRRTTTFQSCAENSSRFAVSFGWDYLADNDVQIARWDAFEMHFALLEPCDGNKAVIMASDHSHQPLVTSDPHGFAHGPLFGILLLHRSPALLNAA
jgi:hypothetical protein